MSFCAKIKTRNAEQMPQYNSTVMYVLTKRRYAKAYKNGVYLRQCDECSLAATLSYILIRPPTPLYRAVSAFKDNNADSRSDQWQKLLRS